MPANEDNNNRKLATKLTLKIVFVNACFVLFCVAVVVVVYEPLRFSAVCSQRELSLPNSIPQIFSTELLSSL